MPNSQVFVEGRGFQDDLQPVKELEGIQLDISRWTISSFDGAEVGGRFSAD